MIVSSFFFFLLNVDFNRGKNLQNSTSFQKHNINHDILHVAQISETYSIRNMTDLFFYLHHVMQRVVHVFCLFFLKSDVNLPLKKKKGALWRHFSLLGELVGGMLPSPPQSTHHCGLLPSAAATVSIVSLQRSERRKLCSRRCHAASTSHHLLSFSLSTDLICIEWSYLSDWSHSFSYSSPPLPVLLCLCVFILKFCPFSSAIFRFLGGAKHFTSRTTAGHNDVTEVWSWRIFAYTKCHTRQKH